MTNQVASTHKPKKKPMVRIIKIRGISIIIVAIAVAVYFKTTSLAFKSDLNVTVLSMFGYLMLISLFVERAIEIILSSWRSAGADKLDRQLEKIKKEFSKYKGDDVVGKVQAQKLSKELEQLEDERSEYRAVSRFAALWIGMVIGVIVSLIGVRILGMLFETFDLTEFQGGLFIVIDLLLTGFVLAGGSEAINKIYKVYSSFMNKVEQNNHQSAEK